MQETMSNVPPRVSWTVLSRDSVHIAEAKVIPDGGVFFLGYDGRWLYAGRSGEEALFVDPDRPLWVGHDKSCLLPTYNAQGFLSRSQCHWREAMFAAYAIGIPMVLYSEKQR